VSPSYTIGRSGAPELADERMTEDQITAREKRERDTEAAFAALQDEIPAYPPRWRSMLEALCVENQHVPEVWLPEVRWMLERIAKAARVPGQKDDKRRGRGGTTGKSPFVRVVGTTGTGSPPSGTGSPSIVPRQAADRDAWLTVARRMRPDLDDAALLEAYRFQGALRDRAMVMRERVVVSLKSHVK
jgi:hypothetical protein